MWDAPKTRHLPCRLGGGSGHRHRNRHSRKRRPCRQTPSPLQLDPDHRLQLQHLGGRTREPGRWSAYAFDWSTDYCSSSPDNPFGFPFATSCARHDFGYRNYKAAGAFDANKSRLDSAFYEDLKRVCAAYSGATKSSCNSTAWTYYQAVNALG